MRDKLIDLIQSAVGGCARHWAELIADRLLSNGVRLDVPETNVGKWVPVSERLPTEGDANEIGGVLAVKVDCGLTLVDSFHWTTVDEFSELFTHWMPMPLVPPEEVDT